MTLLLIWSVISPSPTYKFKQTSYFLGPISYRVTPTNQRFRRFRVSELGNIRNRLKNSGPENVFFLIIRCELLSQRVHNSFSKIPPNVFTIRLRKSKNEKNNFWRHFYFFMYFHIEVEVEVEVELWNFHFFSHSALPHEVFIFYFCHEVFMKNKKLSLGLIASLFCFAHTMNKK